METLLICLLLLYNACLVVFLLREKRESGKQPNEDMESPIMPTENVAEIVGKSHFKMEKKTPQATIQMPQAATSVESEEVAGIDVTFADETDAPVSARLSEDKLDEAFTHVQISDVPLEYGENETEEETTTTSYAAGISFEEIGEAMRIVNSQTVTKEESCRAGQIFNEMDGDELFHQLIKSSSQRARKITELMDYFLSNSISRDGEIAGEVVQLQNTTEVLSDISRFDIRNFV
jgi:hypothetical protein